MRVDKEFEGSSTDWEKATVSFFERAQRKGFTSDELVGATSFNVDFDLHETVRISAFVVTGFVAVFHDLAAKGKIAEVADNRMYFTASLVNKQHLDAV